MQFKPIQECHKVVGFLPVYSFFKADLSSVLKQLNVENLIYGMYRYSGCTYNLPWTTYHDSEENNLCMNVSKTKIVNFQMEKVFHQQRNYHTDLNKIRAQLLFSGIVPSTKLPAVAHLNHVEKTEKLTICLQEKVVSTPILL